ncbi:MAG: hypothetical protein RL410_129 [Actinomycetota bacterium]|jgi:Amt family ammonium transporter
MNSVDTIWVLISATLVLLMTPALAIFYGGMVRAKSVLNMIMMSFATMGTITILWVAYGYSLVFGDDSGSGLIGNFSHLGLSGAVTELVGGEGHQIPAAAFVFFQMTFAIITTALLSGVVADRIRFSSWLIFSAAWFTVVYIPLAHMAFASQSGHGGWLVDHLGALDFAGGTAVEMNSGASALALAFVIGKRLGFKRDPMRPHNLPFVLLGAGLLWFGWFGFNAGSALAVTGTAAVAAINTQIATAVAALAWVVVETRRDGKPTTLGIASGAISGAVAITPACGYVSPLGAVLIGLAAGVCCAIAIGLKYKFGYDDSLDIVGVHGVGGIVGMISIGLLATNAINPVISNGLIAGGGFELLGKQLVAIVVTIAFAFVATWCVAKLVERFWGLRVEPEVEIAGVDTNLHAESAYDFTGVAGAGHLGRL